MANIKINDVPQRIQYVATAPSQSVFPIPFPFLANSDIVAWEDEVKLAQGGAPGQYGLSGAGTASGGTLTLVTAATAGTIITIQGAMPVDRTSIYSPTISNLTGDDLNNDFNSDVIMIKQLETTQVYLQLQYAPWALVSQDPDDTTDRWIPILGDGQIWRKATDGSAIEAVSLPAFPVGSVDGIFTENNRVVITSIAGGENDIAQTALEFVGGVFGTAGGEGSWEIGSDDDLDINPTNNLFLKNQQWPATIGAEGTVLGVVAGVLAYVNVPTVPSPSTTDYIPKFLNTTGSLGNSDFYQDGTDLILPDDPTQNMAAATKQYVDSAIGTLAVLSVNSGVGIDVDNTDPQNPVVNLDSTVLDELDYAILQNGGKIYGVDSVGTDSYAITLTPAPLAYAAGNMYNFLAGTANTGAATLNVNGLGAKTIKKLHDQDLATGDIEAGQIVTVVYDGTNFQMISKVAQTDVPANVVLQTGSPIFGADAGGTDSYSITLTPNPGSYTVGMVINFSANTANTGAATLNVNGIGAIAIKKLHDQDLVTGDIEAGQMVTVIYDGTNFQMQSQVAQTSTASGDAVKKTITQNSHGFSVGNWLYLNSGTYALAQANATATAEEVGIVSAVNSVNSFDITQLGYVSGLSGLTAGTVQWLSDSVAGAMTATQPTTVGYVQKPVFIPDSTTSGWVLSMRGSVVTANTGVPAATQAEMEAAASTVTYVSPGRQFYHPGHPKAWASFNKLSGTPSINESYNVTSISNDGTGVWTITWSITFSNSDPCYTVSAGNLSTGGRVCTTIIDATPTTFQVETWQASASVGNRDAGFNNAIAWGDI